MAKKPTMYEMLDRDIRGAKLAQLIWLKTESSLGDYFQYDGRKSKAAGLMPSEYCDLVDKLDARLLGAEGHEINVILEHMMMMIEGDMKLKGLQTWVELSAADDTSEGPTARKGKNGKSIS